MSALSSLEMEIALERRLLDVHYKNRDAEQAAYHYRKYHELLKKKKKLEWMTTTPASVNDWKQEYGAQVFDPSWRSGLNTLIEEPPKVSPVLLGVLSDLL